MMTAASIWMTLSFTMAVVNRSGSVEKLLYLNLHTLGVVQKIGFTVT